MRCKKCFASGLSPSIHCFEAPEVRPGRRVVGRGLSSSVGPSSPRSKTTNPKSFLSRWSRIDERELKIVSEKGPIGSNVWPARHFLERDVLIPGI